MGALLLSSGVATRWYLLTILTGSYGAGAFGMLGISPLSPSLVEGFGLTRLRVALMVPSIYLGGLLFSPLGYDAVGAGLLVACSQPAGPSRGWPSERRPTARKPAVGMARAHGRGRRGDLRGVRLLARVGAYGWVGVFFVISAELGGSTRAGLLSGVAFASIVVGRW